MCVLNYNISHRNNLQRRIVFFVRVLCARDKDVIIVTITRGVCNADTRVTFCHAPLTLEATTLQVLPLRSSAREETPRSRHREREREIGEHGDAFLQRDHGIRVEKGGRW